MRLRPCGPINDTRTLSQILGRCARLAIDPHSLAGKSAEGGQSDQAVRHTASYELPPPMLGEHTRRGGDTRASRTH